MMRFQKASFDEQRNKPSIVIEHLCTVPWGPYDGAAINVIANIQASVIFSSLVPPSNVKANPPPLASFGPRLFYQVSQGLNINDPQERPYLCVAFVGVPLAWMNSG